MFLAIIAYVLGIFMEFIIPSRGIFRYLNPVRLMELKARLRIGLCWLTCLVGTIQ
jgi:hypothetical protein